MSGGTLFAFAEELLNDSFSDRTCGLLYVIAICRLRLSKVFLNIRTLMCRSRSRREAIRRSSRLCNSWMSALLFPIG